MENEKKESNAEVHAEHLEHPFHHKEKKGITEKVRENPWIISTFVFGIIIIILILGSFFGGFPGTGNVVSTQSAGNNVVNFLIKSLQVQGATLTSITEDPASGVYIVNFNYNGNKTAALQVTKDGRYIDLGGQLVNMITYASYLSSKSSDSTGTQTAVPKTDKPKVELFLMSFCPYGNEAEKTMQSVYNLLKDKVDWKIHFIVNVDGGTVDSLHGAKEVTEDEREACVIKNYDVGTWFTFANYVNNNCGSDGSCWQDAAKTANVDVNKINSCVTSSGLDLMKADETASKAAGASGSPTLRINGVQSNSVYQYGDSEAYKGTICSAFNTSPSECSQKLTSTSTTASGSCA